MDAYTGEIAALGTALCWSFGSCCFTISSRRIGHNYVNQLRLTLALILLTAAHFFIYGRLTPVNLAAHHWFWFGISGFAGFVIGDRMLFKSFVLIGPRLGMLLMSTVPIFSTITAWVFLNEALELKKIIAIAVTLCGVTWVILERRNNNKHEEGHYGLGILCGIGAAFCQALGLILSKKGLGNDFPALSGNIIRVVVSVIIMWCIPFFGEKASLAIKKLADKKATLALFGGSFFGPFAGVWLSLIAVKYAYVGIASTLMALPPIILIPLSYIVFKEKISWGAAIGTVVAIGGVALIFI